MSCALFFRKAIFKNPFRPMANVEEVETKNYDTFLTFENFMIYGRANGFAFNFSSFPSPRPALNSASSSFMDGEENLLNPRWWICCDYYNKFIGQEKQHLTNENMKRTKNFLWEIILECISLQKKKTTNQIWTPRKRIAWCYFFLHDSLLYCYSRFTKTCYIVLLIRII